MLGLTVSQPFASLIASGKKWVENRSWWTEYRGPLAIQAGKGRQHLSRVELRKYPTGCILARAELVACIQLAPDRDAFATRQMQPWAIEQIERAGITLAAVLAHEHTEGPVCWVLNNLRPYREPIPCRGKPGLWAWSEPELVELLEG